MTPEHFTLHEVVAGVWEAEADFTKASVGNAAIVDAGGKTIVVDTFFTTVAARELRAVAEQLTGNSVHLAVNSHWHGDHTNGNQVFSDVPIASTRETLDQIVATAPEDVEAWQAEIAAQLEQLQAAAEAGDSAAAQRVGVMMHLRDYADEWTLTLPDLLISDRLIVEGERTVEISTAGRGHTVSDVVVWLPDERVIVTGDLCWAGIHPRTNDGFPDNWAAYVESLLERDPRHVIPGHGEPGDASLLEDLPTYFRALPAMVSEVAAGVSPQKFDPPAGTEDWAGRDRFHAGLAALAAR